jgi:Uma2 family endonuclease
MSIPKPLRMTADEFIVWALDQPSGRYELAAGEVIAMAPERAGPALVKLEAARALQDAVAAAGLPCQVFPDGRQDR